MRSIDIRVDISGMTTLPGQIELAGTVHLPEPASLPNKPIVMFGVPGGGYGRRYYDLQFEGHQGYSQAEHHTARGVILIALDHVGVGESSLPDPQLLDLPMMGATYSAAVARVRDMLSNGSLVDGLGPLGAFTTVGAGQSMGGAITIVTQGRHRSFDAVAILGYSAIQTVIPGGPGKGPAKIGEADFDFSYAYYFDDVPADIVHLDSKGGLGLRKTVPPWGSGTAPGCGWSLTEPRIVAREAAVIDAPIFLAAGEREVIPNPHHEPAAYPASRHIALHIFERMAHMHNFAGTRRELWDKLCHWAEGLG